MSLRGWNSKNIVGPRGAWTRLDQVEARPERASLARNVRFEPLRVRTRDGFTQAIAISGKATSMHFWSSNIYGIGQLDRLIYFQDGALKWWDFRNLETHTLFSLAGRAASVAEAGNKVYATVFNTQSAGAGQARVIQAAYDIGGVIVDKAFAPPLTTSFTMSDTGTGLCTIGTHKFAYIMESRSGFSGKPGPAPAGSFTPVEYEVTADGRALRLSITLNAPAHAAYLHILMTRADSPAWYFVPGATIALMPGTSVPYTQNINISDDDLVATATLADDHLSYLAQSVSGTGPFNPSAIVSLGRRTGYVVYNKLYVSEIDNHEVLAEDRNVLQVPGQKVIVTAAQVRGVIYLFGPGGTWSTVDNGDYPKLWQAPQVVSESQGTIALLGVCSETAGDFAWVANEPGLWMFDGKYADRPISFMNEPEWKRINWAAPYSIKVVDDYVNQRVHVAAPLDDATEPTHILTWDYSRGRTPETVDFSLDDFTAGAFGSISMVKDITTGRTRLWAAPAAAGYITKSDEDSKSDNGAAIESIWRSGLVLGKSDQKSKENRFGGADVDVQGSGILKSTVYEQGLHNYEVPDEISLEDPPTGNPQLLFDMTGENVSFQVETGRSGEWFNLSAITVYWRRWLYSP